MGYEDRFEEDIDSEIVDEPAANTQVISLALAKRQLAEPSIIANQYTPLIHMAKTFPRNPAQAKMEALEEARVLGGILRRGGEGSLGYYSFKIGGEPIEGVSIWTAQAVRNCWGNCTSYCAIALPVKNEEHGGYDLEGMAFYLDFQRVVLSGRPFNGYLPAAPAKFAKKDDQRARWRTMATSKVVSIAERGIIERAVPRGIVEACLREARDAHKGNLFGGMSEEQARKAVMDRLNLRGVTLEEAQRYVKETFNHWSSEEILQLRDALGALKDKSATVEELFRQPEGPEPGSTFTASDLEAAGVKSSNKAEAASTLEAQKSPAAPSQDVIGQVLGTMNASAPAGEAPPPVAPPAEGAGGKRGRGRPPGAPNKPKTDKDKPSADPVPGSGNGTPPAPAVDSNTAGAVSSTPASPPAAPMNLSDFDDAP